MYIKCIELHFNTKRKPIKVFGAEAQRIFEKKTYRDNVVEVTVDNNIFAIPSTSIAFVEIKPHDVANELKDEIDALEEEIVEDFLEEKSKTYKENDPDLREYLEWYAWSPADWEYDIYAGRLLIGEGPEEDKKLLETKDPVILKKAKQLFKRMADLEQILAGDPHDS
mgnify:CR=1 FL=1